MRHRRAGAMAWGLMCLCLAGCAPENEASTDRTGVSPNAVEPSSASQPAPTNAWFVDATEVTRLDVHHTNGARGKFLFPEIMGPGVGLLDYDGDGDLDVFFPQGGSLEVTSDRTDAPPEARGFGGRLFRNDLQEAAGHSRLGFTDVTGESGIRAYGYGMGVATGDVDNDGCVDLYLTNVGPNELWHNNCDGTFEDWSSFSGTDDDGWSVSAAFIDFDSDGWLDLYVGNYVHYQAALDVLCPSLTGGRDYCPPRTYRAQPDRLYRNLGRGRFEDTSATSLRGRAFGPALGVSTADLDGDGAIDIYVANDGAENQQWMNRGAGGFENTAVWAGSALSADGRAEAGMGVEAADLDDDGDEDLIVAHLTGETHTLYLNDGAGTFRDETVRSGLAASSLGATGFGASVLDVDNDGRLDLLVVNGTVEMTTPGEGPPAYDQPNQLYRNVGNARFEEVTHLGGPAFAVSEASRGAAVGDIDNDGDLDVVVTNNGGPARLLLNQIGARQHWVGLRLIGRDAPRDMLGARVAVIGSDGTTRWRRVRSDGSYASAQDPRVLVGLGPSFGSPRVRVVWPGGGQDEWPEVAVDQWTTLREGDGL